jgi:hypothetical protein
MSNTPPSRAHCPTTQSESVARRSTPTARTNATPPNTVQIARYAPTKYAVGTNDRPASRFPRSTRSNNRIIGAAAGNIIATIIATHVARKSGAAMPIVTSSPISPLPCMCIDESFPACQTTTPHPMAASTSNPPRMMRRGRASGPNPRDDAGLAIAVISRSS